LSKKRGNSGRQFKTNPAILNVHAFPELPKWRNRFIKSITELLKTYPAFSGIHINIEQMPSGNSAYIELLRELGKALPSIVNGKWNRKNGNTCG
jgi:hypothetical protein